MRLLSESPPSGAGTHRWATAVSRSFASMSDRISPAASAAYEQPSLAESPGWNAPESAPSRCQELG